jgi:prolipoprotein diacylglyceryltransferase
MPLFLVIISGYIWYVLFEKPSTLSANVLAIVHPLDAIRSDMLSAKNPGIRH